MVEFIVKAMVEILICPVLNWVELILCIAFLMFIFVEREKTYSKKVRLISAFFIVVINAIQIPMQIQMNRLYIDSIFMIIIYLVFVVNICKELRGDF